MILNKLCVFYVNIYIYIYYIIYIYILYIYIYRKIDREREIDDR